MATVSVIIPHFNRSVLLRDTIASVRQQTFTDWEVIIVDDGSEAAERKALEVYENDARIMVADRKGGVKGPSSCRNQGVRMSSGKYIVFLDSDDLFAPHCLQQRTEIMERHPESDLAIFLMENFKELPGDLKTFFNIDTALSELPGMFLKNTNPWQTMAPIWRKDFFSKTGGFDEQLLFMEDPELHLRAIAKNGASLRICYDKPADCFYRLGFMDDTKKDFWYNSIFYRILFYKKITADNYGDEFLHKHKKDIRDGVFGFIRNFLYNRAASFPDLTDMFFAWMKESSFFSAWEIWKLKQLLSFGHSSGKILQAMRIKGICYKLLP